MTSRDAVLEALRDVVAPMVETDGGELYLVSVEGNEVRVHLSGSCSGCPGATLTTRGVIEPTMRSVSPQLRVVVSTGFILPAGAMRVTISKRA